MGAIMHGCKYSSDQVTGVLIGNIGQKEVQIVDTFPLFHTHALAPMLKVAFMLIEKHCRTIGDVEIVGFYFASPSGSLDISPVKAIADKIASNVSSASLWALDLGKLPEKKLAMVGHAHSKDDWKAISGDAVTVGDE